MLMTLEGIDCSEPRMRGSRMRAEKVLKAGADGPGLLTLLEAVIVLAVCDCRELKRGPERQDALDFVNSSEFESLCRGLGFEPRTWRALAKGVPLSALD